MSNGLIIDPGDQTVVVGITSAAGHTLTLYSDINTTSTVANPLTITVPTRVFVKETVQALVSLKISDVEYGTAAGSALPYTFSDGGIGSCAPVVYSELRQTVSGGGGGGGSTPVGNGTYESGGSTASYKYLGSWLGGDLPAPGTYPAESPAFWDLVVVPAGEVPEANGGNWLADAFGTNAAPSAPAGDLYGVANDGYGRWPAIPQPTGSPVAGGPVVTKVPFAYNTAGLAAGIAVYTPAVGEILLDAWVQITTAWDGTTPKVDIGQIPANSTQGYFSNAFNGSAGLDASVADVEMGDTGGLLSRAAGWSLSGGPGGNVSLSRIVPGRFDSTTPVSLWVTQDSMAGGDAPGATAGAGVLYLMTVVPTT